MMTITERIAELQEYARQDGDRWNESSIADFLVFPQHIETMEGPFIYLDSGNIRSIWRNATRRFSVEFLGEERAKLLVPSANQRFKDLSFNLTGIPNRLTPKSFLAFARKNAYEEDPEEVVPASNYMAQSS
jgi:hypothetical protein